MEERKFIRLKKEEYGIKEFIKRDLGKGKISRLDIEYTPVGEKIIIHTSKPGLVIGRRGEKIEDLTFVLKRRFKLENPHIEIREIENPLFDAQFVADEIALALERMGNLKFKVIAYKKLQEVIRAGALGCELRLSGKLPSDRAKSWRFAEGYLKKSGEPSKEIERAQATALTKTGMIGVKVSIMPPTAHIYDRIDITPEFLEKIKKSLIPKIEEIQEVKKKRSDKKSPDKKTEKKEEKNKNEDVQTVEDTMATHLKPEEDGTAMLVEQELEEGVPQKQTDEDIKKSITKKPKKTKKTEEGK